MAQFMVTVKVAKKPDHDPHNKKTGFCPGNPGRWCSDVTGEHHTVLWDDVSIADAERHWRSLGLHVTRVEEV